MAEKAKGKRINPRNYWRLRNGLSEFEDAQKAWREWCEKKAEEMDLFPDCVNFITGVITKLIGVMTTAKGETKDVREFVRRMDLDDPILVEAKKEFAKVQKAGASVEKILVSTAELYRVEPDCINPKTGAITGGDTIERVDPPPQDDGDYDKELAPDEEESPDAEGTEEAGKA